MSGSDPREIKMNAKCVCGFRPPSDPNDDCERCRLVVEIARLRERCERATSLLRRVTEYIHSGDMVFPADPLWREVEQAADAAGGE